MKMLDNVMTQQQVRFSNINELIFVELADPSKLDLLRSSFPTTRVAS